MRAYFFYQYLTIFGINKLTIATMAATVELRWLKVKRQYLVITVFQNLATQLFSGET